jgi:hypothetical protein
MADTDEEADNRTATSSSTKRVAKKKHYPFGTPSPAHRPFSEFAHLAVDTRSFAIDLAGTGDIQAEVIEDEPKRKSRHSVNPHKPHAKHKHGEGDGEEDDDEHGSQSKGDHSSEALQPCTKIPCQLVIRAIADVEYKNEVERYDLEDEFERYLEELQIFEQEVSQSEQRLEKTNEIGNQLEVKLNQITTKVEYLEKSKEHLSVERTEINTKVRSLIFFLSLLLTQSYFCSLCY